MDQMLLYYFALYFIAFRVLKAYVTATKCNMPHCALSIKQVKQEKNLKWCNVSRKRTLHHPCSIARKMVKISNFLAINIQPNLVYIWFTTRELSRACTNCSGLMRLFTARHFTLISFKVFCHSFAKCPSNDFSFDIYNGFGMPIKGFSLAV